MLVTMFQTCYSCYIGSPGSFSTVCPSRLIYILCYCAVLGKKMKSTDDYGLVLGKFDSFFQLQKSSFLRERDSITSSSQWNNTYTYVYCNLAEHCNYEPCSEHHQQNVGFRTPATQPSPDAGGSEERDLSNGKLFICNSRC